jgi:hypothetical protein
MGVAESISQLEKREMIVFGDVGVDEISKSPGSLIGFTPDLGVECSATTIGSISQKYTHN